MRRCHKEFRSCSATARQFAAAPRRKGPETIRSRWHVSSLELELQSTRHARTRRAVAFFKIRPVRKVISFEVQVECLGLAQWLPIVHQRLDPRGSIELEGMTRNRRDIVGRADIAENPGQT